MEDLGNPKGLPEELSALLPPHLREIANKMERMAEERRPKTDPSVTGKLVVELMTAVPAFKPGDVVRFKEGLCNRRFPQPGEKAVVTRVVPGRCNTQAEAGDPRFNEPLELSIAAIVSNGSFGEYAVDARRFELAK